MTKLSATLLSQVLYYLDPMHTLCEINEAEDEYDEISQYILNRLDFNQEMLSEENQEVIQEAFTKYFEEELEQDSLNEIAALLDF